MQYENGTLDDNDANNENIFPGDHLITSSNQHLVPFSHLPKPRETRLLQLGEKSYQRIFSNLIMKQKGLCHGCRNPILKGDAILRRGKRKAKYYHAECAKKLSIF
jgi:hypothetical protein